MGITYRIVRRVKPHKWKKSPEENVWLANDTVYRNPSIAKGQLTRRKNLDHNDHFEFKIQSVLDDQWEDL